MWGKGPHKDQEQAPQSHDVQGLMSVLMLQGYDVSQEEVERLMGRIDFDKNGNIDFEEFTTGLLDWRAVSAQCRDSGSRPARLLDNVKGRSLLS